MRCMVQAASLVGSVILNAVNTAGGFAVSPQVNELILDQLVSAAITDASA